MPVATSILEEAERVAAARWAATEPAPRDGSAHREQGGHRAAVPEHAQVSAAAYPVPTPLAGHVAHRPPGDHTAGRPARGAGGETWLIRQMLCHDGLTIAVLTVVSMLLLVGLLLLAPYLF